MTDYEKAKAEGLTKIDRWSEGKLNHPMSVRLVTFLAEHDFNDYNDYFCWKIGGDGDNGQTLAFQMDAFFEMLDRTESPQLSKTQSAALDRIERCKKIIKIAEEWSENQVMPEGQLCIAALKDLRRILFAEDSEINSPAPKSHPNTAATLPNSHP